MPDSMRMSAVPVVEDRCAAARNMPAAPFSPAPGLLECGHVKVPPSQAKEKEKTRPTFARTGLRQGFSTLQSNIQQGTPNIHRIPWRFRVDCWALMSFSHSTPIPITAAARSGARHALRGCGKRVASLPKIDFRVQMKRLSGIMPGFKTNSGAHLARLGVWRKRNKGHAREVSVSGN